MHMNSYELICIPVRLEFIWTRKFISRTPVQRSSTQFNGVQRIHLEVHLEGQNDNLTDISGMDQNMDQRRHKSGSAAPQCRVDARAVPWWSHEDATTGQRWSHKGATVTSWQSWQCHCEAMASSWLRRVVLVAYTMALPWRRCGALALPWGPLGVAALIYAR